MEANLKQCKTICVNENGINLLIKITDEGDINLLHMSALDYDESLISERKHKWYRLFEIQESGGNQNDHHGNKKTGSSPGKDMKYVGHKLYKNQYGTKLEIIAQDEKGLCAIAHMQFYDGVCVVRSWTELENKGAEDRTIEFVTSFNLVGIDKEGERDWPDKTRVGIAHNTWQSECQWREYTPQELGLYKPYSFSLKRITASGTGTWPSAEYLPIGYITNTETESTVFWQIETACSWEWEISIMARQLYLSLCGATFSDNGWYKTLRTGDKFVSDKTAVAFVKGDWQDANIEMTKYRRIIRRKNADNESMAVIFNDFMNCLVGDATTEKLIPLIDAAAETGCGYFCIDAGWYDDEPWWDGAGEWLPAKGRCPGGIEEPIKDISQKGMVSGLWLELEVMGINCPMAKKVPDNWFFVRNGKRVIDHSRYQLDYRNPEVRAYADSVIDRLVGEYGVGYIKMDYNINAGVGTEIDADSFGDGLRQHTDAYLDWLDGVFERYPDLIIENCGSGGQRMTYAYLSKHSIQSVTDQEDYRNMASIASACATALTPEQAAMWSYPQRDGDRDEVVFNMVNAMLLRVHQSGHLGEISKDRLALVKEGIDVYKSIRDDIKTGYPVFPLGLTNLGDPYSAFGIDAGDKLYLAVWRVNSDESEKFIPLRLKDRVIDKAETIYPSYREGTIEIADGGVKTTIDKNVSAALYKIAFK